GIEEIARDQGQARACVLQEQDVGQQAAPEDREPGSYPEAHSLGRHPRHQELAPGPEGRTKGQAHGCRHVL
ncbi:hypothetical protein BGW39_008832, partial [Mortierella sp. 14UC]